MKILSRNMKRKYTSNSIWESKDKYQNLTMISYKNFKAHLSKYGDNSLHNGKNEEKQLIYKMKNRS